MKPLHLTLLYLLYASSSLFAQVQNGAIYLPPTQIFSGSFGIASDKFYTNANLTRMGLDLGIRMFL